MTRSSYGKVSERLTLLILAIEPFPIHFPTDHIFFPIEPGLFNMAETDAILIL